MASQTSDFQPWGGGEARSSVMGPGKEPVDGAKRTKVEAARQPQSPSDAPGAASGPAGGRRPPAALEARGEREVPRGGVGTIKTPPAAPGPVAPRTPDTSVPTQAVAPRLGPTAPWTQAGQSGNAPPEGAVAGPRDPTPTPNAGVAEGTGVSLGGTARGRAELGDDATAIALRVSAARPAAMTRVAQGNSGGQPGTPPTGGTVNRPRATGGLT